MRRHAQAWRTLAAADNCNSPLKNDHQAASPSWHEQLVRFLAETSNGTELCWDV
ncbi:MAG: hypothetical protein R3C01_02980 [Planctomycetaceae bacterium]